MRRSNAKPLVTLIAAYAIALQAVLAGMMLAAQASQAAMLPGILCVTDPANPGHPPAEPMPCCISAACCPAGADTGTLPLAAVTPVALKFRAYRAAVPADETIDVFASGPQQPRAPPAV